MTQPGGGHGGNDINLAALWIPVMPETKGLGEEMRKAGQESKRQFEQGFNSGASPESMGQSFGSKLQSSISHEFRNFELPFGGSSFLDKFSGDIDQKLVAKLRGPATQALQSYRQEWENLQAAQTRATDVETKLATAREQGFNKASIMLPLIQQQTAAQNALTEAHTKTATALDVYNTKQGKLTEELSKGADGGKIMAGIMGGAMVFGAQLAVGGIEKLVDTVAEGFKGAIEITKELAESAVELGETYEHIGIQIHEFSTATGQDFESMEASAQHVFSTLDVAGLDTGKTMAQFASILDTSGESVAGLTRYTEELQGRFTTLKATDLASIFVAFNTPADQADKSLASLLESARNSGQDLGQLTSALSGTAAVTLKDAGLNIEQAGAFMGELLKLGAPGRQVMTGMTTAMKEFGKEGVTFSDGMKMAGDKLKELGDTAEGQDLAEKLFGARNWTVASRAVQDYMDILNQGPDAFSANVSGIDEFLGETETLGNKVEEFKHKAMDAFKPFGEAAKNAAINGLNSVSTWFSTHHQEIIGDIKEWGDKFIDFLPTLQSWSVSAIRIFGDLAGAIAVIWSPIATLLATAGAGLLAVTGHFGDAGDLLKAAKDFDVAAYTGKIATTVNGLADKIENIHIDTDAIKDNFNDAADAAGRIPQGLGSGLGANTFGGPSADGFPSPGGSAGGFPSPGGAGGGLAGAPTASQPGQWGFGSQQQLGGPPVGPGGHHADWDAIAQKESSGNWSNADTGHNGHYGGLQISPSTWYEFGGLAVADRPDHATKEQQIAIAERILNGWGTVKGQGPGAWDNGRTYVERKAGGGPIGGFAGYDRGGEIDSAHQLGYGPEDFASPDEYLRWYLLQGHIQHAERMGYAGGGEIDEPHAIDPADYANTDQYLHAVHLAQILGHITRMGYAGGGLASMPTGAHVTGGTGSKDDVPALLTKGEYVWDTKTMDKYGWLIQAMHQGALGFDSGGGVGVNGLDTAGAQIDTIAVAAAANKLFGITDIGMFRNADGYNEHASGEAADVMVGNNKELGDAVAQYFLQNAQAFGVQYVLWQQAQWNPDGSHSGMSDRGGATANHLDHVHVRTLGGGFSAGDRHPGYAAPHTGTTSDQPSMVGSFVQGFGGSGGGTIPAGSNGPQFPGMEGQYGGYGVYGGQTADQARSAEKAVQEARDRAADLDHQITVQQKNIDDLKAQIASVGVSTKLDVFGKPYPLTPEEQKTAADKKKQLSDQLDESTYQLSVHQRERGEQEGNISDALRKQQEGAYKKPSGTGTSADRKDTKTEGMASALGSGLLSGIGQELGFGDLFSKPPWEWGAVKLLTGAASWAMGTANAWADEIGKGHTGVTGFQPVEGWDDSSGGGGGILGGLAGGLGISTLPKGGVSSGPNIATADPKQGMPTPYGALGTPPGPVVTGDYMPINVQAGVDPKAILGPVQEQRNSQNAHLHGQTGGLPQ